ncbi:MAG: ABC transporter substrate-binding protein [Lentisphaeria bacterium]|nr:ABC transporter substrate-binding protein [Lentisphaeria bacterium]
MTKPLLFALHIASHIFIGLVGLLVIFLLLSWLMSPGKIDHMAGDTSTPEELSQAHELRDQSIDLETPIRVQVPVDYSQAERAPWWPKQEAPILVSLVEEGVLPPLEDRVPQEPLVLAGVNGPGNYGGTMYRLGKLPPAMLSGAHLVRFSPQGFPIVPHLAKSWEIKNDGRDFVFKLRKGTRWSDGHPFTSADILYWWENEQCDPALSANGPQPAFRHCGEFMSVTAPDPLTITFSFAEPYYLFLSKLASFDGTMPLFSPEHFLKTYHPAHGDKDKIRDVMEQHNLVNEAAVYNFVKRRIECPRLTPWIPKTEHATPPETYVRNPYYFAVDAEGRQLPYMDRIVCDNKSPDMMTISAAQGGVTAQSRFMKFTDYTMLMRQREAGGYQVYHLKGSGAKGYAFNLNRRVPPGDPESADKARLLKDKRFRQALSVAVNREEIIEAVTAGLSRPHTIGPVAPSFFHIPGSGRKYIHYDPEGAGKLLDACGLTGRDADGYRRFPGGPNLLFDINGASSWVDDSAEFIIDDWRKVGIHARIRTQDRSVFYVEKAGGLHDITIWGGYGDDYPLLDPRYYFPFSSESNFAVKNALWYSSGGIYKETSMGEKPPVDSPLYRGMLLYERLKREPTAEARREIFAEILAIAEEQVYVLNIHTPTPAIRIVKNGVLNVPTKATQSWTFQTPLNMGPETWCYEKPVPLSSEERELRQELTACSPVRPLHGSGMAAASPSSASPQPSDVGGVLTRLLFYGMAACLALFIILGIMRYPFLGHRLIIMIPTLLIISIISFIVIEIPPGDAITSKIMTMEEEGGNVDEKEIHDLKTLFRTDEPAWKRYTWWMGVDWFFTFNPRDKGLLQGNMGRSMIDMKPVNEKVGDRLLFTFLISLGTILFTWIIALPIGVYSAVRQYTLFDYIFTIGGFIGMCIPGFLLALLFMFGAEVLFDLKVSGLFSPKYAAQTGWSMGKVLDLLRHLWLPVLVQGVAGTAGMIRVMRANLLDELKKPYVITARAKGVRPLKLLLKYPVRIALNPFVSGIGGIFPALISGGAIVAIVMSLPTIGPMQLEAVMQQDMYLAGSMLMVLSTLSVLGTLFSDILLLLLDPRIRMGSMSK